MELGKNIAPIQDYKERIRLFDPIASMLTKVTPIQGCKIRTVAFSPNIGNIGDFRPLIIYNNKFLFLLISIYRLRQNPLYRLYRPYSDSDVRYTNLCKKELI